VNVFGYQACSRCTAAVLNEIAWKTDGLCSTCFRDSPNVREIIAVTKDREKIRLTLSKRTPGERAQRTRAKKRARSRDEQREKARASALASTRAKAALTRAYPEVYEVLLAEERAKVGLEPWTLDRALTPHRVTDETMEHLRAYHASEQKATPC
jgi:hypothetical protein